MRARNFDRENQSPIRRDLVRGSGGLGSGWFTMTNSDNVAYDPTSNVLGTQSGVPVTNESATPIAIS